MTTRVTVTDAVLEAVRRGGRLAVHEVHTVVRDGLGIPCSENAIATRLNDHERAGHLRSEYRHDIDGKSLRYKEWWYVPQTVQEQMTIELKKYFGVNP